jgi:hypothetical protein
MGRKKRAFAFLKKRAYVWACLKIILGASKKNLITFHRAQIINTITFYPYRGNYIEDKANKKT